MSLCGGIKSYGIEFGKGRPGTKRPCALPEEI